MTPTPRKTSAILCGLALALMATGACTEDTTGAPDVTGDTTPETTTPPTFTVQIDASALAGNAPLEVDFDVIVSGADGADLRYAWFIDDILASQDKAFQWPYYVAGSSTVRVEVTWTGPTGEQATEQASVVIRIQGCADLTFDRVTLAQPADVAPGDALRLQNARLLNDGDTIEVSFDVAVFLSVDARFEADIDTEIARWSEDGMASGLLGEVVIDYAGRDVSIPAETPEGNYFVFLVADPDGVVNECIDSNNWESSTNNLTVDVAAGLKPDVVLTEVGASSGSVLGPGDTLTYEYTLANQGLGEALSFRTGFWLSEDLVLSPQTDLVVADPAAEGSKVQQLGPGRALSFYKSFQVPSDLAEGEYWLIGQVDVDDELRESSEINNVTTSTFPITIAVIVQDCADLELVEIIVDPLSTYWDGSVRLEATVANPGNQPVAAGALLRAQLSLSASPNPQTAFVAGEWTLGAVPAGATQTVSQIIPISSELPVLPHYVSAVVDPDDRVVECDEANNTAQFAEQLTINATASVDLAVGDVTYHPSVVTAGEAIKVQTTVSNSGTSGATAFELGFVLSVDETVTRAGITAGDDVLIYTVALNGVPADGEVTVVEDVVIPLALDHQLNDYYLAVVSDVRQLIGQDEVGDNDISVAPGGLTVLGAQGGCYEDDREDDDTLADATALSPGLTTELGSCGDIDWFSVDVPGGNTLFVDVTSRQIDHVLDISSELVVTLTDATGATIDSSDRVGALDSVRAYVVSAGGTYYVSVAPKDERVRARYDVNVTLDQPTTGVDLFLDDVVTEPSSLYPGGLMRVRWRAVNIGKTAAPAHKVRVWISPDTTLDRGFDQPIGELAVDGTPALTVQDGELDVVLPTALETGDWFLIVALDADDDVVEDDETNNVGFGNPVHLDAELRCEDDALEPNDEQRIATPLATDDGTHVMRDLAVCPGLDDWYSIALIPGRSFRAEVGYSYTSAKGYLQIDLVDPSGAVLREHYISGSPFVEIPYAWLPGTYYIRVTNRPLSNREGPYDYTLTITNGVADPEFECAIDSYEPNNAPLDAKPAGCGLLSAALCNADVDWFVIDADEGSEVQLTLNNSRSELRVGLYTDPARSPVRTRSGNGTLSYLPTADGILMLKVESRYSSTTLRGFDYTLDIEGIAGVDLSVSALHLPIGEVVQGEDVQFEATITNGCTENAGPFETTLWLSLDPFLDADDVPIHTFVVAGGLDAGETVDVSQRVPVPRSTLPGAYWVLVQADSGDAIAESNDQNNARGLPLTVRGRCDPDELEPNDVVTTVEGLATLDTSGRDGLTICPFDQDWFKIVAKAGDLLTVTARFAQSDGDLELRLYDPASSLSVPIASATSSTDDEVLVYAVPVDATLLVRVAGFGANTASYSLELTVTR